MVRRALLIALVATLLMGCAVLLVVGCAGLGSEPSQKEQGHTEATKEQAHSPGATASEEARCEGTRYITWLGARYATNDVPGCPTGGLLSATARQTLLLGKKGNDEVRGLGGSDELYGGDGNDVLYGGAGSDFLEGEQDDDVIYGGDDGETLVLGGRGDDVIYGGDGKDYLDGVDCPPVQQHPNCSGKVEQRDALYCGEGWDRYLADKLDYVSSSCEKKELPSPRPFADTGGPPLVLLAGAALLLSSGLMMSRYVIRRTT